MPVSLAINGLYYTSMRVKTHAYDELSHHKARNNIKSHKQGEE